MIRFEKILCEVGRDQSLEQQLGRAVDLALHHQATLTVIDVLEPRRSGPHLLGNECPESAILASHSNQLDRAVAPFRSRIAIKIRVVSGTPFLCIIRQVMEGGHDLVIRESEDPGWLDRVLGSDDMQLVRQCPCPLWLVDPSGPPVCRCVIAAVDVDREYPAQELDTRHVLNRRVLDLAFSIAITESAELHVVHAWHSVSAMYPGIPVDLLDEFIERTRGEHAVAFTDLLVETMDAIGPASAVALKHQEHLVDGHARREIPRLAKRIGADLVVMGSVARTGVPGLFVGNTAETILGQIDCSVLIVKPPGFVSTVTQTSGHVANGPAHE